MPGENIDRAIKKGTGQLEGVTYEEITYEGYGPGGAAILVQVTTDNQNRTVAEVRHVFSRHGGNLGTPNSVAWMFEKKGLLSLEASAVDEDTVLEVALDAGAEDVARDGDQLTITTPPGQLHSVQDALQARKFKTGAGEFAMIPKSTVKVEGKDAGRLLGLIEALDELEDVAKVFSNFDIDAETLAAVGG